MPVKLLQGRDNKMTTFSSIIGKGKEARILTARPAGLSESAKKKFPHLVEEPKVTPPTKVTAPISPVKETIQLGKEPAFDIKEFREGESLAAKAVKVATDWRTTIVLLATLATIGGGAAYIASRGGLAAISTAATNKAFVARVTARLAIPAVRGKIVSTGYVPGAVAAARTGFPTVSGGLATVLTNPKTAALTTKLLVGAGLTLGAAALARDIIGTYPFAAFGKEEALQGIGFPLNKALDAGDIEGAQMILDASNELVNAAPTLADKIPYLNVQKAFGQYVEAQAIANIEWQRLIDERLKEAEGEGEFESPFEKAAREREERDIQTKADIEESRRVSEETFQRRQKEIEEGVEARDEAERIKFEEIRKENTLFFEAIRKRNAGIELTDEERKILIDRGVDPDPIKSTFRRKSLVQF